MAKKTISVYQAMLDLKLMKKQFAELKKEFDLLDADCKNPFAKKDRLMNIPFIAIRTKSGFEIGSPHDIDKLSSKLQSNFDSYNHLFWNIEAYTSAIAKSNAATMVKIQDKEYTVVQLIKIKELSSDYLKFLEFAQRQVSYANSLVLAKNATVNADWEAYHNAITNNGELQLDADYVDKTKVDFYDSHTYELIDPVDLYSNIDKKIAEFNAFLSDIDTALTTSNITTIIDIELLD